MADDERKLTANITPFGLRMQPELKRAVEEAAKTNTRSINAEIVSRLEESFTVQVTSLSTVEAVLSTMETAVEEAKMRRLEAQSMASMVALLKHTALRLADLYDEDLPADMALLVEWLKAEPEASAIAEMDTAALLTQAGAALENLGSAQAEYETPESESKRAEAKAKLEAVRGGPKLLP